MTRASASRTPRRSRWLASRSNISAALTSTNGTVSRSAGSSYSASTLEMSSPFSSCNPGYRPPASRGYVGSGACSRPGSKMSSNVALIAAWMLTCTAAASGASSR
jgi:hypothetical protein